MLANRAYSKRLSTHCSSKWGQHRNTLALFKMSTRTYTLTILGDLMLGRLVDQLLPQHVEELEEAEHAAHFRRSYSQLQDYNTSSPWGNSLELLKKSDLILANLETAVTNHNNRWPNKVFNYRMHPANVECVKAANVAYVSLANNHTLDFNREGLFETVETIDSAGIAHAGAGRTLQEAEKPAILRLRRTSSDEDSSEHEIHVYSFSDHPGDWASVPEFNLLKYTSAYRAKLKDLLTRAHPGLTSSPSLKIISVHWGPNYSWEPDTEITSTARFLIDDCGIDIIHGHSSHHVQGVEVYRGKLIIYGCGDFIDDYAVNPKFRNDLSAAWNVTVAESTVGKLEVKKLEVFPNRIFKFQAGLLSKDHRDHEFVCDKLRELCGNFGTTVNRELGDGGQLIVDIERNSSRST